MDKKLLEKLDAPIGTTVELSSHYGKLSATRSGFLDRGRQYSRDTLPYVLPETDNGRSGAANTQGYSSHPAQCVNSLANRLANNLFPSHQPFFSLDWSEEQKELLKEAGYEPSELTEVLTSCVRKAHEFEGHVEGRVALINVLKHLVITGNACLYAPESGLRCIPLSHYCIERDSSDHLNELMTMQKAALNTFDQEIQSVVKEKAFKMNAKDDDEVTVYTLAKRMDKDTFKVVQTIEDVLVKEAQLIKEEDLPWIPLRWNTCYGEDYGRGLVEDAYSDISVIVFLSEALIKGMVMMSDVKYLVRQGSITSPEDLANAPTGEFLVGSAEDVTVLQLERYADFTPISNVLKDYERRLGQVFLMQSASRREGERVTAYEIRLDAQEFNESLGGIYSHLSVTLQKPYAKLQLKRTNFPLEMKDIEPHITTGLEALSKASDLDKLRVFTETMGLVQSWSPELQQRTDLYLMARRVASSLSLDLDYVRNDEEQAMLTQQQQQQAMEQNAMMEASKALPNVIEGAAGQMMQGDNG